MVSWNEGEIKLLEEQYTNVGYSVSAIARGLGKTESSVRNKAIRLGITRGVKRWKERYVNFLITHYKDKGPKWCGLQLGYKRETIIARANKLGLTRRFDRWSEEDIVVLIELVNMHLPLIEMSFGLNKSVEQIKNKMQKLRLEANHWSQREIEILKSDYHSNNSGELSLLLKRDKKAIFDKAYQLGLTNPHWAYIEDKHQYPPEWTSELKAQIMERDNFTCQLQQCKDTPLCVHHIDYNKSNCKPSNLITLCFCCHAKTNVHRNYWTSLFQGSTNITQ